jgi:phage tail tape-measure protein
MPKHNIKHSKKHMGKGFIEDITQRPISTIASYALPSLLGSAGGISGGEIGLLAGPVGSAVGAAAGSALGSFAGKKLAEELRRKGVGYSNKRSMIGGAMMVNNPSLSGYTMSSNGTYQRVMPRMKGMGQTSAYGTISSEFGQIMV